MTEEIVFEIRVPRRTRLTQRRDRHPYPPQCCALVEGEGRSPSEQVRKMKTEGGYDPSRCQFAGRIKINKRWYCRVHAALKLTGRKRTW